MAQVSAPYSPSDRPGQVPAERSGREILRDTLHRQSLHAQLEIVRALLDDYDPRIGIPLKLLNQNRRRIERLILQSARAVEALRRPCCCRMCTKTRQAKRWPAYYLVNGVCSFECRLELMSAPHFSDDAEFLRDLANDPARIGAAIDARFR